MTATHTPRRLLLAAAALASVAGAGLPTVVSAADSGDGAVDVVLESAGDQSNAITLPAVAEVGQRATTTMVLGIDLGVEASGVDTDAGIGMEMAMTTEVIELTAEGGYVALSTVDAVEVTETPEGVDTSEVPCVGSSEVQLRQTFDAAGNTLSIEPVDTADPAAQLCAEQLSSSQSQATVVYPTEPVGPGASWTGELETESQGITMPVTYHYTLTDVSEGRYTVEVAFDSEFDVEQSGLEGSGRVSGTGTTTASTDNPLDVDANFDVAIDLESTTEDAEFRMAVDVLIDMLSETPAA